jgi:hypothetical protein
VIDHPANAKFIGEHAPVRTPGCIGDGRFDLAAGGKAVEELIRLLLTVGFEREAGPIPVDYFLPLRFEHVGRHQNISLADRQGNVHELILVGGRNLAIARARHVLEAGDVRKLAAKNGFVEVECFFRVVLKVDIWVECCHSTIVIVVKWIIINSCTRRSVCRGALPAREVRLRRPEMARASAIQQLHRATSISRPSIPRGDRW